MSETTIASAIDSVGSPILPPGPPRVLVSSAIALALTILTWPIRSLRPSSDLDPSWQIALHMGIHNHLRFGRQILFTYGPLGFLSQPILAYRWTGALAVLFAAGVHFAFLSTVFVLARRWLSGLASAALAAAAGLLSPFEPVQLIPLIFIMWVLASDSGESTARDAFLIRLGAFLSALVVLIKFDTGVALTAVVTSLIVFGQDRLRRGIEAVALFSLTVPALWLMSRNHLADIFPWLNGSIHLASGYGAAMSQELEGRSFEYLLAAILALALLELCFSSRSESPVSFKVVMTLLILVHFEFRHAFVRHESLHSVPFFFFLALLPTALLWKGSGARLARIYIVSGLAMAAILALPVNNPIADAYKDPGRAWNQVWTLLSSSRSTQLISDTKASLRSSFGLGSHLDALLTGQSVHSDPVDVSLVWAYGFHWRPTPIFQTYSVYTGWLDDADAEFLRSPSAPERIIRRLFLHFSPGNPPFPIRAIDNRNPYFEGPRSYLESLCYYRQSAATSEWQVLDRVPGRCGQPRLLETVRVGTARVRVPAPAPGQILVATIQIPRSITQTMMALLFKPLGNPQISLDSRSYHLVTGTAGDPLVLCAPRSAGFSGSFAPLQCPNTMRLSQLPSSIVRFYSVTIANPT